MMGPGASASAPGKVILLGEHSVVFGHPALALAIDRRMTCHLKPSGSMRLNGFPLDPERNPHVRHALETLWEGGPLDIRTESMIPSGSGLGSSAALSVAFVGALQARQGESDPEAAARAGFDMEFAAQGRASPLDTSASAHGGGVAIKSEEEEGHLWTLERDGKRWCVHDIPVPEMTLVVGHSGVSAPTGPLVGRVRSYFDKSGFAREIVDEMGAIAQEGEAALKAGDLELLGRLMTKNHKMLSILGVSTDRLNKLVDASLPHSYGAKLTGAGGGGSMIALTDKPELVCDAIARHGGTPYAVRTGVPGLQTEPPL